MNHSDDKIKIEKRKRHIDNGGKIVKMIVSICSLVISTLSIFCTVGVSIAAFFVGEKLINEINQEQTQVVIEPREGDIIVQLDEDDDYKLLQLIQYSDIKFPDKVQEIQIKSNNNSDPNIADENRVEINNINGEDWSSRDSFKYMISNFSINPNKVINLVGTVNKMTVYCDFYKEKNIATKIQLSEEDCFKFEIIKDVEDKGSNEIKISNIEHESEKEYVTKEINDGIEWVKIRVVIVYKIPIEGKDYLIKDEIISDWIPTDADF